MEGRGIPTPRSRPALVVSVLSLAALVPLALVGRWAIRELNFIENSAEQYQALGDTFSFTSMALAALLTAGVLNGRTSANPPFAKAQRLSTMLLIVGLIAYWLPVLFCLTRVLTLVLLDVVAALNLAVMLRTAWDGWRPPPAGPPRAIVGPWALLNAVLAVALSLTLDKLNSLGWAFGLD